MFEKEAEEYALENYENCLYVDFPYVNDSRAREQTFKDGAEYGYNKALDEATHNYNAIIADYDKRIAELKGQVEMSYEVYNNNLDYSYHIEEKLTEAKELLKRWVDAKVTVSEQKDLIADTEQFLNGEVEK